MDNKQLSFFVLSVMVFLTIILHAIYYYIHLIRHDYFRCPKCGHEFRAKLTSFSQRVDTVDGKIIKCPNCKFKDYMKPAKSK